MTYPPEVSDSRTGTIIAFVVGGLFILLLGIWVASRQPGAEVATPPALRLLEPVDGAVVTLPLELRFHVDAELGVGRGGWGTGPFHLHADVDGFEIMPAAADLAALGEGEYRWTVRGVEAGQRTLRLTWSDPSHRVLEQGASQPVTIIIE
jgi:hypothetical protein